jgi:DNA polymerase-3 subunit delta
MHRLEALLTHFQRVKAGKENLYPLYVFCSDEALFMMESKDMLRELVREQGFLERETLMNETGFDWSLLLSSVQTISLFGEKKFLELSVPTGKPGREGGESLKTFAQYIEQNSATESQTITCIYLPRLDGATQKSAWFTALSESRICGSNGCYGACATASLD